MAEAEQSADTDFIARRELVDRIAGAITRDATPSEPDAMDDIEILEIAKPTDAESDFEEDIGAEDLMRLPNDGFFSALAVIIIPGEIRSRRRLAAISRPFAFVAKVGKERLAVVAPPRYVTDFASIPPFAQIFISPFGKHAEAAVIHDWLYAIGDTGDGKGRRRADRAFCIALRHLEVKPIRRFMMYAAVRLGGGRAYGAEKEFNFRRLTDLTPVNPAPVREPYLRTVACISLKKKKTSATETAQA